MLSDQALIGNVLSLLREWGWETGIEKLKAEIECSQSEEERAALRYFIGWMAAMRGEYAETLEQLKAIESVDGMKGWTEVGRAFVALRQNRYTEANARLDDAQTHCDPDDRVLQATIYHCRGAVAFRLGNRDALRLLHEALEMFGKDSFGVGRVLDTLGMVYASTDNFHAAREFFHQAIQYKKRFKDDAGLALTEGQLGRLYLDWGNLNTAAKHFKEDLNISRHIADRRGEAQMYNSLGQVAIAKGKWEEAASWLDRSIDISKEKGWTVLEAFARNDRGRVHLHMRELAETEQQVMEAQSLFKAADFAEGIAHVNRLLGSLLCTQDRYAESEKRLRESLRYFVDHGEQAEACRTQLAIARTLRAQGAPQPLVSDAFQDALIIAERCRHDALVQEVGRDLLEVDAAEYYRRAYDRARGHDVVNQTDSLLSGVREDATVVFLDVQNSTEYVRSNDPEVVMMTLNQMMAEFSDVLKQYGASVTAYLGDGFMALVRDTEHAARSVSAALELVESLKEFNRPREVLGLKPLNTRIGIATGGVFIGNVGTYGKMDFTAIGTPANLAARIQSEAEPGVPCISRETHARVKDRFIFKEGSPRSVSLKGLGIEEVWDVAEAIAR
jgi:class 3 adenylate cyclase/Tfp pilus assembly protein PilF